MSRRCKPGQRARIINGPDRGKIVVVVRHYFHGERVSSGTWPTPLFPWVVTSLGAPLYWVRLDRSAEGTDMTIVVDDCDLEPLRDDDDGLMRSTEKDRPREKPQATPVMGDKRLHRTDEDATMSAGVLVRRGLPE